MYDKVRRIGVLIAAGILSACAAFDPDLQPVVDSLHTPEMEAAIKAAGPGTPRDTATSPRT
jgi:hypothetical protein